MIPSLFRRRPSAALAAALVPLALGAQPKPDEPVRLPPYNVISAPSKETRFHAFFEGLNHKFDGPFPELRSGPMVEAILWRHRFLEEHPKEDAVIVTTADGGRVVSATTVYTLGGRLYASSNALGEHRLFEGMKAGELRRAGAAEIFRRQILLWRRQLSDPDGGAFDQLDLKPELGMNQGAVVPNRMAGFGADMAADAEQMNGPPTLNSALVIAEDTGNYDILTKLAGQPTAVRAPGALSGPSRSAAGMLNDGAALANLDFRNAQLQAFFEPSGEILSWTYGVLRDPRRAGLVPVALGEVTFPAKQGKARTFRALSFDWEGRQYVYEPDRGTFAWDLPRNPLTGQPFLCLHGDGGGLLECVYFCAIYPRSHPGERAVLIPGTPAAVAYTANGKVAFFGLALAPFPLPPRFGPPLLADLKGLSALRGRVAAEIARRRADPNAKAVPAALPGDQMGDEIGMQMRRAYLAFHGASIPCALDEGASPVLSFSWARVAYAWGADGLVRARPIP
ncbi:MAG TPA: hypothetical protein VHC86_09450 [Opitutaceae bacterium]|nr:hypothetical protein [Opitutaceae bacterium]